MKKLLLGLASGVTMAAAAQSESPEEITIGYLNLVNAQLVPKTLADTQIHA
ncbi:MAG: hypothetical protein AAGA38_00595 [Pseudomonadota bacterium]